MLKNTISTIAPKSQHAFGRMSKINPKEEPIMMTILLASLCILGFYAVYFIFKPLFYFMCIVALFVCVFNAPESNPSGWYSEKMYTRPESYKPEL
jgi:hypothetical protein